MGEFLSGQLDFIFFFYGLAFILLGSVCFAIVRSGYEPSTWFWLGWFGITHGIAEWLDLFALAVSDSPEFAMVRTGVMTLSFLFLCKFARRSAVERGWNVPGVWIYLPGLLVVGYCALFIDRPTADAAARYIFGISGAAGAAAIFAADGWRSSGQERRLDFAAAISFAIYAIATGIIVNEANFWPASDINSQWFLQATSIPIQMVRGLTACSISVIAWSMWEHKQVAEVSSPLYARHLKSQYLLMIGAIGCILLAGWMLTEHLGTIYKSNVEVQSRGNLDLLASRLDAETSAVAGMAQTLAGSLALKSMVGPAEQEEREQLLDIAVHASGADVGYVVDSAGRVIAVAGNGSVADGNDLTLARFFKSSQRGVPSTALWYDAKSGGTYFYASHPISSAKTVEGVVVLKRSLANFEADLRRYDGAFFLVNPEGIVILTNRPEAQLRAMWPLSPDELRELEPLYGPGVRKPLLNHELLSAGWTSFENVRDYVRRRFIPNSRWSLVLANPTEEIYASRVLGIAITLFGTVMTLVYLLGRERRIYDRVEADKRLELQELATALQFRATTDPLTGLSNRLRFNEALSMEMMRAQRYGTPLSLVLYDIDHFKDINDSYGHLTGDSVLIEMSRLVASRIRATDMLARWGGEEFAVLLPNTTADMAAKFAEQLRAAIDASSFASIGKVSCSLGVAEYLGETAESFIARADRALYRAKLAGRNRVEVDRDMLREDSESAA